MLNIVKVSSWVMTLSLIPLVITHFGYSMYEKIIINTEVSELQSTFHLSILIKRSLYFCL